MNHTAPPIVAFRMTLHGQVQGIGLRPAVIRLAQKLSLTGSVSNSVDGVCVLIEGTSEDVAAFRRQLPKELPAAANLTAIDVEACSPRGFTDFQFFESQTSGPLATRVPPDKATCPACIHDAMTHQGRRRGYAFTSCTDCGPRYSIIDTMPYDRCRTSMASFALCPSCHNEFTSTTDRRFHAQTNACPACGPHLRIKHPQGQAEDCPPDTSALSDAVHSEAALASAADAVLAGSVLALQGLGGYQLIVDATNAAAIERLRQRKQRPSKPLAVMVSSLPVAARQAALSSVEQTVLTGPENPIVLARVRCESAGNADSASTTTSSSTELCHAEIHPGLNDVGLFLPTTPLHRLLLERAGRPLVVTSGNVDGDPLTVTAADAERNLSGIADEWLHHDRPIVRPIDDSVVRVIADRPVTIRNARGFAPLPLPAVERFVRQHWEADHNLPPVLALGGQQKVALALFNGQQAVLGSHIGDLNSLASRKRFLEQVEQLTSLYACRPQLIVHDSHPDYFTTRWTESADHALPVQHHHAHVVSAMVNNDWLDREVLGVAFDGTGYGTDGTVWGGEFLRATVHAFERVAHLRPFRLAGGESAVREPWRVAVSLLRDAAGQNARARVANAVRGRGSRMATDFESITALAESRMSPVTTSAGRLFDGIASLVLGVDAADFEGHPAMLLESAADASVTDGYDFEIAEGMPLQLDWRPVVRQVLNDLELGCPEGVMAAKFHRGLARGIATVCCRFNLPLVLTGGVFQNRLLAEWLLDELAESPFEVGRHSTVPPNDGGLAAGQLAIGLAWLSQQKERS